MENYESVHFIRKPLKPKMITQPYLNNEHSMTNIHIVIIIIMHKLEIGLAVAHCSIT